ncbi:MAG: hypothetical protein OEM91_07590 [Hyphomicrobiales bacterium]|nr:hypothetical protein [Hyphomicrobiales bacterium]
MATSQPTEGPRSLYGIAPVPGRPQPAAQPLNPEQLAADLQTALKAIKCYTARIDGDWGRGSRAALQRFNALARTSFAADIPTPEALAAVTSWDGGNCKIVAKRTPRKRTTTTRRRTTTPPPQQAPARRRGGIGAIIGGGGVGIGF